jgi:hypothetical protein
MLLVASDLREPKRPLLRHPQVDRDVQGAPVKVPLGNAVQELTSVVDSLDRARTALLPLRATPADARLLLILQRAVPRDGLSTTIRPPQAPRERAVAPAR